MAIPFASITDFQPAQLPPALSGLLQGMNFAQQYQAGNLANQIKQIQAQFLPQGMQADLAYKQALSNQATSRSALAQAQTSAYPTLNALREAQAQLAQAQTSAYPTLNALRKAQASAIPSQVALRKAQAQQALSNANPLEKDRLNQLAGDMKNVTSQANEAMTNTLPMYNNLIDDLNNTELTGPAGNIAWSTPAGQKFSADLTKAQGEFIKQFHLGRMSQVEFNLLKGAVGKPTMYKSVLQQLFQNQINKANQSINKLQFYHNYIGQGGRDPQEVQLNWGKQIGAIPKYDFSKVSQDDWEYTAQKMSKEKGRQITANDVKRMYGAL